MILVFFPNVSIILDAMLKLVDPKSQLLVQYLSSIDYSNSARVLPQKGVEGTTKASKIPKKNKQVEKPPTVEEEVVKESIPMKTGVLRRTKKPSKKPFKLPIKLTTQEGLKASIY